ncbi:AraC family transcriptional regulator [Paenibacillus silvae]|uniref:AraC family transcriptional regulator n=1 Tax=Paenibacillus silvae TaxID=1325358 RepID=UPI003CF99BA0
MNKQDRYIEQFAPLRIAYMRHIGPYGPVNIETMELLKSWAIQRELLTHTAILLGIAQDDPATTAPDHCRYDACIVIPDDYIFDEQKEHINTGGFSGGTYLVVTVKHTAEDIQHAWSEVTPYLQASGYRLDHKPVLERYRPELLDQHLCEICIPVTII